MAHKSIILFSLILITLISFAAEDLTEETPQRLGPAIGSFSTPLSIGFRFPIANHYSIDILGHIPQYVSSKVEHGPELAGLQFGALFGYSLPVHLEENIAFVIRPHIDISYLSQSGNIFEDSLGADDYKRSELALRLGAFLGMEVFLEEVGIPNVNVALGLTAGTEYDAIYEDFDGNKVKTSSFRMPLVGSSPFGATFGVWWYF